MDWIADHQVLIAGVILVVLVVVGLMILFRQALTLSRTAKEAQRRVEGPVAGISSGIADAERRVGMIADGQVELEQAIERVGARTDELRFLVDTAGRAIEVLRSPFRYVGK